MRDCPNKHKWKHRQSQDSRTRQRRGRFQFLASLCQAMEHHCDRNEHSMATLCRDVAHFHKMKASEEPDEATDSATEAESDAESPDDGSDAPHLVSDSSFLASSESEDSDDEDFGEGNSNSRG